MITMAPSLPPSVPRDEAILGAMALLSALGNAANTQATLTQMAEHKQAIDAATAENTAAAAAAAAAQAELANLQERERAVTAREEAVASAQTALDVASSANAARAASLDDREAELAKHIAEHEAKVKANEDRIAQVRASLSA
jgi:chromosome segregation ATPase